jgi:hypothetical protein
LSAKAWASAFAPALVERAATPIESRYWLKSPIRAAVSASLAFADEPLSRKTPAPKRRVRESAATIRPLLRIRLPFTNRPKACAALRMRTLSLCPFGGGLVNLDLTP